MRRIMQCDQTISEWEILLKALPLVFNSEAPEDELKRCRSVLELIVRVPPGQRGSVDAAVEWLFMHPSAHTGTLLQACGLHLIKQYFDDLLSAQSSAFLERLFEAFRRHQELRLQMDSARSDYEQECSMSQKFSDAENAFREHHLSLRLQRPDEIDEIEEEKRLKFFEAKKYRMSSAQLDTRDQKFHKKLIMFASQVCVSVAAYSDETLKEDSFDSFFSESRERDFGHAKDDIKR